MNGNVGAYLSGIRQTKGLSLARLAVLAQVSRATLHNWESGRSLPRVQELEAVLRALPASKAEAQHALALLPAPRARQRLKEIETLPMHLPHGGDLLRALRLRRDWTQAQTAAMICVGQTTLARWERGEMWPGTELLHSLCYALQAHGVEISVLTAGAFALVTDSRPRESVTVETLEFGLAAVHTQLRAPDYYSMGDLLYLSLEAQAIPLARKSETGEITLARILLDHAAYLGERCQPAEAGRVAEKALALLPERGERWNSMRMAAALFWAVWKYPGVAHARMLMPWLDCSLDVRSRTWVMSQIGASLCDRGDTEAGIELERQAYAMAAETDHPHAIVHRRNNFAETLINAGRAAEAAELLCVSETLSLASRVRVKIALTRAHLTSGNRSRAHDWLCEVHTDNALLGITYYQPQIVALAEQM